MSKLVSLPAHERLGRGGTIQADLVPVALPLSTALPSDDAQRARAALQEVVFALTVTHAQACTTIDEIESQPARDRLRAQFERIGALLETAWRRIDQI